MTFLERLYFILNTSQIYLGDSHPEFLISNFIKVINLPEYQINPADNAKFEEELDRLNLEAHAIEEAIERYKGYVKEGRAQDFVNEQEEAEDNYKEQIKEISTNEKWIRDLKNKIREEEKEIEEKIKEYNELDKQAYPKHKISLSVKICNDYYKLLRQRHITEPKTANCVRCPICNIEIRNDKERVECDVCHKAMCKSCRCKKMEEIKRDPDGNEEIVLFKVCWGCYSLYFYSSYTHFGDRDIQTSTTMSIKMSSTNPSTPSRLSALLN